VDTLISGFVIFGFIDRRYFRRLLGFCGAARGAAPGGGGYLFSRSQAYRSRHHEPRTFQKRIIKPTAQAFHAFPRQVAFAHMI